MAVAHGIRQQAKIGGRLLRKRRDSEENIYLDFNRENGELTQEILEKVVNQDVNSNQKLAYLNGLVKLSMKEKNINFGVPYKDIFCCLRISFFHETCEVRAGGLRACRYILQNEEALKAFIHTKLPFLISRSLDILLDNRIERIQALRVMRKVLCLNPFEFPRAFTSCLVAIANEGPQERDMLRPCLATLAQLTLLNPKACIEACGVSALMKNVVDNSQPQTAEAILATIFYLINHPSTRSLMKDNFGLETLLAPFTDCHYRFPTGIDGSTSEDRDPNLSASKAAIVCTLLSWSGLTYLCKTDCCHLQSLIQMLYLPYSDLRKNILDLLYQIFNLTIPEWTSDFSVAQSSADPSAVKSSWQLHEGYVVAEGTHILSYSSKDRTNLVHNYYALLVLVFVQSGILEALSEMVVTAEINLAVRATVFLGEFIYLANQFLPVDCSQLSNCLPMLMSSAACFESSKEKNQATAALTCLFRIHEMKKRGAVPNSLVLGNILHVCDPEREKKGFFAGTVSRTRLWKYLKQEMTDGMEQALKDTQVLTKDFISWDWDLIDCLLKNPSEALKKLDDANTRTFVKKLLHFFKPSSKEFSEIELDKEHGRQICITGCHLVEYFLELDEIKTQEYLDEFLGDFNGCLVQLSKDGDRLNSILSPIKVLNTFSQMYFLFIGKLSSTHKGCKFLNRCNTFQNLLHLVSTTNQEIFIKLIVSALDYTKEGFSRAVLTKVLTGTEEATRLYATNFLLILLRAKLPDFRKWALEILVTQLYDSSKVVASAALEILDEACTIKENLEAVIDIDPQLLRMGDKGLLLKMRFLSVPKGFKSLKDSNFLHYQLEQWQQEYNMKYVKIIEDLLNEAFTHHRRSEDGTYGRRSSETSHSTHSVYLPPHIYGQLVQHAEGLEVLENEAVLPELYNILKYPDFSSEVSILHLKAALWAVGHVGSYPLGLESVLKENLIPHIVKLAANAPVLSARGTCYFVLGLLGSTPEGATAVGEYGWESVKRNHEDKWPLIKEEFLIEYSQFVRKSTWSFSSMSSDWPLGGFPTNLSFIVRTSELDLSRSQSQSSYGSSLDTFQNSLPTKGFVEYQSKHPYNEPSSSSDDARPRSSSDCQSDKKENVLFQIAESSSWDALNSNSSFLPPSNFNRYAKRRSISTSEVDTKVAVLQSESSEESVQDEEHSPSSNLSFLTNNFLYESKLHSITEPKPIHHVPSNSSINSSSKCSNAVARPSLLEQLSQGQNTYLQSPTSPERPSSLLLTSARDAIGYATLKDIQRHRLNSLTFHDSSTSCVDVSLRHLKSQSLDADSAKTFNVTQNDLLFSESEEDSLRSTIPSQDSDIQEPAVRYIGLCLPSKLDFIFYVPKDNKEDFEEISNEDFSKVPSISCDAVFEFHSEENCISNHACTSKRNLQSLIIDEESDETSSHLVESSDEGLSKVFKSLSRSNSVKGMPKSKEDLLNSQHLIRKECMRYVTNLCSSVAVKASEQGLLNLKQKFPLAFQDICLYSEICYYMANYNFRLSARRFMQELFLDVSFEQLQWEAEAIVGIISIPQIGGSEV